jgi:superfamily II RNA helicase
LPCVIFTFSKKKINSLAAQIYTYDLLEGSEKSKITRMFASALSNLKPEDQ